MITRKTVLCLGSAQLISWGVSFYLVGAFGTAIAAETGWSDSLVYGVLSLALLMMGLSAPTIGRLIDRLGGRGVLACGSVFNAAGCCAIALSRDVATYYAAWVLLGIGMQLTLYDAGFATLARLGGVEARRAMAQITLLGGLSSTTFWPLGGMLSEYLGWRGALLVYAACALATLPLHLAIPPGRHAALPTSAAVAARGFTGGIGRDQRLAAGLYMVMMTLASFLNVGMASHMIAILTGLGLTFSVAVWVGTLRGIGQSTARLADVLFGRRIPPLTLNLFACALLPLAFILGLFSGHHPLAGMAFAFLYGAGNGLLTITRGTVPLVLFDSGAYGTIMGTLIAPSLVLSAAAPLVYALVVEHLGEVGAIHASTLASAVTLAAAGLLLAHRRTVP